ncbi:MAG: translation initiation factor IF-2 [Candidatus Omnitrophica bacterium]|nr:translation initiation factor IF-2 [Candidatus Omnitrophota bacterium]
MRVHELAKELKLTSKELMAQLKKLKVEAKNHMSVVPQDKVRLLKESVKKPATSTKPAVKTVSVAAPRGSIESAKKELLMQRSGLRAAQAAATVKKSSPPQSHGVSAPARISTVFPSPLKPKSHVVDKKSPAIHAAPFVRQEPVAAPAPPASLEPKKVKKIPIQAPIIVKDLAQKLGVKSSDVIQRLIRLNIFANINQSIHFDAASQVAQELGFELEHPAVEASSPGVQVRAAAVDKSQLVLRAPIVTFMGHVDHGKTSLLDAIRNTKVAAKEAGGITQHIGAYEVFLPKGAIAFLDTPGHEAFTAMRARGARVTDIVVLVVAADDGVMPQTLEAIDHAKAAGVTMIVAINKIDLPSANVDRVKKALMEHGLTPEDWGGKTIMVGVSAKTGQGIDDLLEMLVLEAELLELRANPKASARGVVIEAKLSKESGVLATVLVQDGTLHVGDPVVVGPHYCRVRAMINDRGQRVKEALPSTPVEILGLSGVPRAGDNFYGVEDERVAKETTDKLRESQKAAGVQSSGHISLEHLYEEIKAGKVEELKLIIKSDVQGSVEALRSTLEKIQSKNVRLNVIHSGIGDISESDVMLAAASNAVVIGFHVAIPSDAKELAEREEVDVRFYEIIYEVKTSIEKAMEGLLAPELKEVAVGTAEVRQVFKVSKIGTIAGCAVLKGKIVRNFPCHVLRNGQKVHDGKVESLKRFKDDAREVLEGFECGIGVSGFDGIQPGDRIEAYEIQKKERKLE